jgi:hypothetical protein
MLGRQIGVCGYGATTLAPDQTQAYGGNQVMAMGILFWICAGVIGFAVMQAAFMLLLQDTDSEQ